MYILRSDCFFFNKSYVSRGWLSSDEVGNVLKLCGCTAVCVDKKLNIYNMTEQSQRQVGCCVNEWLNEWNTVVAICCWSKTINIFLCIVFNCTYVQKYLSCHIVFTCILFLSKNKKRPTSYGLNVATGRVTSWGVIQAKYKSHIELNELLPLNWNSYKCLWMCVNFCPAL